MPWKYRRLVIGTGTGRLPVMAGVKREAQRRKIQLLILPTAEAIKKLKQKLRRNKRDTACRVLMRIRSRQQPSDFHLNVVTSDPDRIGRNRERRRWADHLSGSDVEDRPVPRTRYLVARQHALRKRTAPMGAGVVNGMKRSSDIEQGDPITARLNPDC
jgi:hypothetical protein